MDWQLVLKNVGKAISNVRYNARVLCKVGRKFAVECFSICFRSLQQHFDIMPRLLDKAKQGLLDAFGDVVESTSAKSLSDADISDGVHIDRATAAVAGVSGLESSCLTLAPPQPSRAGSTLRLEQIDAGTAWHSRSLDSYLRH